MEQFTIPNNIEDAVLDLKGLGELITAKQWKRAALVWAFTAEVGRGKQSKCSQLSISEFSKLSISGLESRNTIAKYRKAWAKAMEDGLVANVSPGDQIELPDAEWEKYFDPKTEKKEPAQLDPGPKPEERKMKGKLNPRKRIVRKSSFIASASATARVPEKHAPFVERLAKALKGMTLSSDPTTEYVAACLALADLVASLQEEGK